MEASERIVTVKAPEWQSSQHGGGESSLAPEVEPSATAGVRGSRLPVDPLRAVPRISLSLRPAVRGGRMAPRSPGRRNAARPDVVGEPRARKPLGSSAVVRRAVGRADALV